MTYLPAPVGGWNPDANPWEIADTQAPVLDNALIRPGRVSPRGALTNWADLSGVSSPGPPLNVCGVQPVPGTTKLAIGRKLPDPTGFVDPWFAPIVRPAAASALAQPDADLVVASGANAFTSTATAHNLIPGPRGISFEGTRYFIGYGTLTAPVLDAGGTFYGQSTNLCTLSLGGTPTAMTNAPRGFIDIKGYQSRIWGLGGIDDPGSGTTFSPLTLFFTNPIGPGGGNAASFADWKDPVGGTTNKIVMDGDTTDPGVGLAVVRNGLLIFRYASVWLLKGATTANYTLVPVSRDTGCIDPRSIVESDEGVYYMSRQGLMLTNGVTVKNVSGTVLHTLQSAIEQVTTAIKSSFGGYVSCALASGGQIIVSIGVPAVTSGQPDGHMQPIWCAMFDPTYNAWTRVTSALFSDATILVPGNQYPCYVFNTPDRRLLSIGDKYITQWEAETGSAASTTLSTTNLPTNAINDASAGSVPWSNPTFVELAGGSSATAALTAVSAAGYAGNATQTSTGKIAWVNPSDATGAPDGVPANPNGHPSAGQQYETIELSGYGFAIPGGATILGIQFDMSRWSPTTGSTDDVAINALKAGSIVGASTTVAGNWSTTVSNIDVVGGPGSLWGTTWTPADINNAGFGIAIAAQCTGTYASGSARLDAVKATVYYTTAGSSEILTASSYGYAIPATATITGIQVAIARNSSAGAIDDEMVQLTKAGTRVGSNKASATAWPTSLTTATYGGSTDLWGTTWTFSDINNTGFGVSLQAQLRSGVTDTAAVDAITVTVYYTLANVVKQQSFVKTPALYDTDVAGNFQPIPFVWKTKLLPTVGATSATRKKSQLKRYVTDYVFQGIGLPSTKGFTVTLQDSTGAQLSDTSATKVLAATNNSMTSSSISGGQPNASTTIQRDNQDCWPEVIDMCVVIAWLDAAQTTSPSFIAAEFYGVGVEFQHTSELR